jgi:hypothetical protein
MSEDRNYLEEYFGFVKPIAKQVKELIALKRRATVYQWLGSARLVLFWTSWR